MSDEDKSDEDKSGQDKNSQLKDRQDKVILDAKLRNFYFASILSLMFAVLGFTYNAWRLEQSEENNNIRSASFQILVELAELEQIIYLAHYDKDLKEGSPRKGWIEVGLINDLSMLVGDSVYTNATELTSSWSARWQLMADDRVAVDQLVTDIDAVRYAVKEKLKTLM